MPAAPPTDDLTGLAYTVLICAALAGIGKALDVLLRPHQAKTLRRHLARWWAAIEGMEPADVPATMASAFLRWEKRLLGQRPSWRWFLTALSISVTLTMASLLLGEMVWYESVVWEDPFYWNLTIAIPTNYALDLLTLLATVFILSRFLAISSTLLRLLLLAADLALAFVLAAICYQIGEFAEFGAVLAEPDAFLEFPVLWGELLAADLDRLDGIFFYANTTLIPTAAYVLLLAAMTLSLFTYRIVAFVVSHILAVSLETEKSIFLLTGAFAGLVGLVGRLLQATLAWLG